MVTGEAEGEAAGEVTRPYDTTTMMNSRSLFCCSFGVYAYWIATSLYICEKGGRYFLLLSVDKRSPDSTACLFVFARS